MVIQVRVPTPSDIPEIITLFQGFQYPFGEEHYRWKYLQCPWGSVAVVAETDNNIIGHFGHVFRPFWIKNQESILGLTADLFVHKDYRGRGVFSEMSRVSLELTANRGVNLLYGFPNELSLPRNVTLGAESMGYLPFYIKIFTFF